MCWGYLIPHRFALRNDVFVELARVAACCCHSRQFHMVRVVVCDGEKTRVMALVSLRFHAVLPYTISILERI